MTRSRQTADNALIRAINRALILRHLRAASPQSRANLAGRTGLMRSTVSSLVDELIAANFVHEIGMEPSRGGRPGTLLALNPAGGGAIGVEITPDAVVVLLTDFLAQPRWQRQVALDTPDSAAVLAQAEQLIDEALRFNAAGGGPRLFGIGAGIAGLVNVRDGTLRPTTTARWENIPLRAAWEQRFGLPVRVGNEASIAALGEHYFGAAAGITDFIFLGLRPRAIGAGIFIEGRLYQGFDGYAGEAGHMLIAPDGPLCSCGRRGCWEALWRDLCRASHLRKRLAALGVTPGELTLYDLLAAAPDDLGAAGALVAEVIDLLAAGMANLINLFNPQMIVLGGPVGMALAPHLDAVQQAAAAQIVIPRENIPAVVVSQIASNACALGAVALVLDDMLSQTPSLGSV